MCDCMLYSISYLRQSRMKLGVFDSAINELSSSTRTIPFNVFKFHYVICCLIQVILKKFS